MGTPSLDEHNSVIFHPILKSWGCFETGKASFFRWSSSCSHRFTRLGATIEPSAIMQPESWENNHHLILVKNSFFSKSAPKLIWLSLDFHYLRWEESESKGDGVGIWPLTPRQIWPIVPCHFMQVNSTTICEIVDNYSKTLNLYAHTSLPRFYGSKWVHARKLELTLALNATETTITTTTTTTIFLPAVKFINSFILPWCLFARETLRWNCQTPPIAFILSPQKLPRTLWFESDHVGAELPQIEEARDPGKSLNCHFASHRQQMQTRQNGTSFCVWIHGRGKQSLRPFIR